MRVRALLSLCLPFLGLVEETAAQSPAPNAAPVKPSWTELAKTQIPGWFVDARLGIAVQWGVSSVPGRSLDYARQMYLVPEEGQSNPVWAYHQKHYGHPGKFGYKDLIPYWEAKAWDPAALTKIFKDAGARYVVVLATDRDNFDLFASPEQPWNSTRLGPRRDIVGDWAKALRASSLKWGVACHQGRSWWQLRASHGEEWLGDKAGQPFDGQLTARDGDEQWWQGLDPRDLYGAPRPGDPFAPEPPRSGQAADLPPLKYQENWYKRMTRLVDSYRPDLVWMNTPLPHGDWGLRWATEFYQKGRPRNVGTLTENVLALPPAPGVPASAHIVHVAPGANFSGARGRVWQRELWLAEGGIRTDLPPVNSALQLQSALTETISSRGNLLIQVALTADGILPDSHREALQGLGLWVRQCSTALFGTTPGPKVPNLPVSLLQNKEKGCTYVIFREWPTTRKVTLPGLGKAQSGSWLGGGAAGLQSMGADLVVELPTRPPGVGLGVLELAVAASESVLEY